MRRRFAAVFYGGVWERCIRTTLKFLRALLQTQTVDDEGLVTLLCEVESIINGRPISTVSGDCNDPELFTPNHLLILLCEPQMPSWVIPKGRLLLPTLMETSAVSRRYLLEAMV